MDIAKNKELSKLYNACEKGDVNYIKSLGKNIETLLMIELNGENSPLIVAADSGNTELVKILIKSGADVNYRTDLGETALDVACVAKDTESVRFILAHGGNPLSIDRFGISILERAKDSGPEITSMIKKSIAKLKS